MDGEIKRLKSGGMLMVSSYRVDVPRSKEVKGTRDAKGVDNFFWSVEQYFCAGIE